jgi:hypothetical protein
LLSDEEVEVIIAEMDLDWNTMVQDYTYDERYTVIAQYLIGLTERIRRTALRETYFQILVDNGIIGQNDLSAFYLVYLITDYEAGVIPDASLYFVNSSANEVDAGQFLSLKMASPYGEVIRTINEAITRKFAP